MGLDSKEFDSLTELCDDAHTHSDRLTEWEQKFMADILERLHEFDIRTYISDKQWEVINRIERKLYST